VERASSEHCSLRATQVLLVVVMSSSHLSLSFSLFFLVLNLTQHHGMKAGIRVHEHLTTSCRRDKYGGGGLY
jgi:hypothetical protein